MNAAEKLAARELLAKTRATHGWAFRDLPEAEVQAIRDFLLGDGPCPEDYTHAYALTREQLGLPDPFKPEQFERNHAAIHEAAPGTCKPCDKVYRWKKLEEG